MPKSDAVTRAPITPLAAPEGLAALITAVLNNAEELCKDADVLLRVRRFHRCLALASLALEEVGKAVLVAECVRTSEAPPKRGWSHEVKMRAAYAASEALGDGTSAEDLSWVPGQVVADRMESLYVDWSAGRVTGGTSDVEFGAETLDLAQRLVTHLRATILAS
jgi:AbiV family abortive infection protein